MIPPLRPALPALSFPPGGAGGTIEVTAEQVALSNQSTIDTSVAGDGFPAHRPQLPGHITFNVGTFSATDSAILSTGGFSTAGGGAVTIQGLQGSGTFAHSVSLAKTEVDTFCSYRELGIFPFIGGPILIRADKIALNQSTLNASGGEALGGPITLVSRGGLDIRNSSLNVTSDRYRQAARLT